MAHAVCFDTLAYANKLKEGGFSNRQAEIQAEALGEIFEDRVATKQDIKSIKHAIESLGNNMNVKFAESKVEMIKWVICISGTQAALIISVLKFFN